MPPEETYCFYPEALKLNSSVLLTYHYYCGGNGGGKLAKYA
jgi:hypothetical protein